MKNTLTLGMISFIWVSSILGVSRWDWHRMGELVTTVGPVPFVWFPSNQLKVRMEQTDDRREKASLPVLQVGWQGNTSGSRFYSVAQNRSGLSSDGCYWPSIIVISLAFVLSWIHIKTHWMGASNLEERPRNNWLLYCPRVKWSWRQGGE